MAYWWIPLAIEGAKKLASGNESTAPATTKFTPTMDMTPKLPVAPPPMERPAGGADLGPAQPGMIPMVAPPPPPSLPVAPPSPSPMPTQPYPGGRLPIQPPPTEEQLGAGGGFVY